MTDIIIHGERHGFICKTRSEQRLEWLESLRRPLSDQESEELQRCLHAVYERNRRQRVTV